jgi:nitrous oxidase accessory protein NosD
MNMIDEVSVAPGESVQRALDASGPGATVRLAEGEYPGNLWIRHSGVTLIGAGAGTTVITPGEVRSAEIPPLHDAPPEVVSGIAIHGDGARDVRVEGLTVRDFSGAGVYVHSAQHVHLEDVHVEGNAVWGIYLRESSGLAVRRCKASGSQYAGIGVSFCPAAQAQLDQCETFANAFGVFVDNSSFVKLLRSTSHGNAAGVLLLNQTYAGELRGGVSDCLVADNDIYANTLASGGNPEGLGAAGPPISGVGLSMIGTTRVTAVGNRVRGHHPGGPSVMGAAIVVGSSKDWGGDDPVDNYLLWNESVDNAPLDIAIADGIPSQYLANNAARLTAPEKIDGCTVPEVQ